MVYSIITNDTRAKVVINKLLEKYKNLYSDKDINESSLSDLYMIDNGTKYYVHNGYAEKLIDGYRINVEV